MKIVISDCSWGDISVEKQFLPRQTTVEGYQLRTEEELIEACWDADGILSEYAPFTRRVIQRLERCKVISQSAIGFDNIDLQAAREKGIAVCHVPGYCAEEVADHTMALMLDCLRKVTFFDREVREGRWELSGGIRRLRGMTLGLLGFGDIARCVARRAQAFGLEVLVWSRSMTPEKAASFGLTCASQEQVLRRADVISCHLPLLAQTRRYFDDERFAQCKKGVIFINTARGGLVDEGALCRALQSGQVALAGLDVMDREPPDFSHPLLSDPRVIVTPHAGFYSEEALVEVRRRSAQNVAGVLTGCLEQVCYVGGGSQ